MSGRKSYAQARALHTIERDRYQLQKALSDLEIGNWPELAGMHPAALKAALEQRLNEIKDEMGRGSAASG